MSDYGPFPANIYDEISKLDGNTKCCDCSSLDCEWGNVNHGTLICLECAGKHRSLGVHVSFVRSIYMDTWSPLQLEMMRQGGNGQIKDFFDKIDLVYQNNHITSIYSTEGASFYRHRLKDRVDQVLAGEFPSERVRRTSNDKPRTNNSGSKSPSLTLLDRNDKPRSMSFDNNNDVTIDNNNNSNNNNNNSNNCKSFNINVNKASTKDLVEMLINCTFGEGPMGMTITKNNQGFAVVSRLLPHTPAQLSGIEVGDIIVGIAKKKVVTYDEIMKLIMQVQRPILLTFKRLIATSLLHNCHLPIPLSVALSNNNNNNNNNNNLPFSARKSSPGPIYTRSNNNTPRLSNSPRITSISASNKCSISSSSDEDDKNNNDILFTNFKEIDDNDEYIDKNNDIDDINLFDGLEIVEKDININLFNNNDINKDVSNDSNCNKLINNDQYLNNYKIDKEKSLQRKFNLQNIPEINTNIVISDSNNNNNELEYEELNNYYISPDTPVQVMCNDVSQLAIIKKDNKNGSYKVIYHDGREESNVTVDRICILQSDLEYNDKLSLMYAAADTLFDVDYIDKTCKNHISNDMMDNYNSYSNSNSISSNKRNEYYENSSKNNNNVENGNLLDETVLEKWLLEENNNNDDEEDDDNKDDDDNDFNNNEYNIIQYYISKDFRITFNNPPFGMTVTKKISTGSAEITRIIPDGNAFKSGIEIGDILIGIGTQFVTDYDDAMNILKLNKNFPLEIVFRRKILTNNNNNNNNNIL